MGRNNKKGNKGKFYKNNNNNSNNNNHQANVQAKQRRIEDENNIIAKLNFEWEKRESDLLEEETQTISRWTSRLSHTVPENYKDIINKEISTAIIQAKTLENHCKVQELNKFFTEHPNVSIMKEEWPNREVSQITITSQIDTTYSKQRN